MGRKEGSLTDHDNRLMDVSSCCCFSSFFFPFSFSFGGQQSYTREDVESLAPMEGASGDDRSYVTRREGEYMAASYVNFYIANEAVVVPQFGDPDSDEDAIKTLERLFPHRTVIGVSSRSILLGGGNIHCITQQIPKQQDQLQQQQNGQDPQQEQHHHHPHRED